MNINQCYNQADKMQEAIWPEWMKSATENRAKHQKQKGSVNHEEAPLLHGHTV